MALQVTQLERSFTLDKGDGKKVALSDPGSGLSPDEVLKFHSSTYPELTNAVIDGPHIVGDKANYTVKTKAGRLG